MPTYRTPDVYVEEISVFPPSVADQPNRTSTSEVADGT